MGRIREARRFNARILGCPECRRRFIRLKDLNLHLLVRHEADYIVRLPRTATAPAHACKRGG